jgi:hypothetical protein
MEEDTFFDELKTTFPKMYGDVYCGMWVDKGWHKIIYELSKNIQRHIDWKNKDIVVVPQVTVAQIKEKWGGLRFYYDGGDDTIDGMVQMAEVWAQHTCEMCGERATKQTTGWIKTVCDKHFDELEEQKRNLK